MSTYQIFASKNRDYIVLEVEGDLTSHEALDQNVEAHKLGDSLGLNKYLVDLRSARNADSIGTVYDFAYKDMKGTTGVNLAAKVALVVDPDDHSHDFVETVAQNAGLDVRLFRTCSDAMQYLEVEGAENE